MLTVVKETSALQRRYNYSDDLVKAVNLTDIFS